MKYQQCANCIVLRHFFLYSFNFVNQYYIIEELRARTASVATFLIEDKKAVVFIDSPVLFVICT